MSDYKKYSLSPLVMYERSCIQQFMFSFRCEVSPSCVTSSRTWTRSTWARHTWARLCAGRGRAEPWWPPWAGPWSTGPWATATASGGPAARADPGPSTLTARWCAATVSHLFNNGNMCFILTSVKTIIKTNFFSCFKILSKILNSRFFNQHGHSVILHSTKYQNFI